MTLPSFRFVILPAVTLLSIQVAAAGELTLTWVPPEKGKIAGYIIQWGTESGKYAHSVDVGLLTEATFKDLDKGQTYYFVIGAYHDHAKKKPFVLSPEIKYQVP